MFETWNYGLFGVLVVFPHFSQFHIGLVYNDQSQSWKKHEPVLNQYWIPCVPRVFRHKALIGQQQQRRQPSVCWLPSVLPSDEEFQKVLGKCWARALEFATPCFPSGIWDWREAWLHPRFPRGASRKHGKGLQHCQSQGYPQRQSPGKGKVIWSCQRKLEGRSSAGTPNI